MSASLDQAESILDFWFGPDVDTTPASVVAERQAALWWSKNEQADADIRSRFEALLADAADNKLAAWADTPRGLLALIILLDQFPRNMYRGTAKSFSYDELARQCSHLALAMGVDQQLPPIARVFVYLPLEHAEDVDDQDYCVQLFRALAKIAGTDEAEKKAFAGFADFAKKHQDIIARFGRFPHRNAILGRASTAEETAFLQTPGSSF